MRLSKSRAARKTEPKLSMFVICNLSGSIIIMLVPFCFLLSLKVILTLVALISRFLRIEGIKNIQYTVT